MVEPGIGAQVVERAAGARLRISGAVDEATDPGRDAGTSAHGTRFERHHKSRIFEPPAADRDRGVSEGKHLGVCSRITRQLALVVTSSHYLVADEHNRADRHVPMARGNERLVQGDRHGRDLDLCRFVQNGVAGPCRQIGGHVQSVELSARQPAPGGARVAGAFRLVVVSGQCERGEPAVVALDAGAAARVHE